MKSNKKLAIILCNGPCTENIATPNNLRSMQGYNDKKIGYYPHRMKLMRVSVE